MNSIATRIKRLSFFSAVVLLGGFSMLMSGTVAIASADADPSACTAPSGGVGVNRPIGADSGTYTWQCTGPNAGKWTNAYYAYDPATGAKTPLYSPAYAYDCATGKWTMTQWDYSPATGGFVQSRIAPATTPNLATGCDVPGSNSPAATGTTDPGSGGSTIANTGPGSNNTANQNTVLNGTTTNNTGLSMNNTIGLNSNSGDTSVVGNTTGGSAGSGNATSVANIANLLQSTSANAFGPDTAVFTANINGDVTGDFMFDPSAILASGPGSNNTATDTQQVNVTNTNNTSAAINNDINVGATSGNATVSGNTTGGDASTGNANAVVNLMNLINSTVASGQSFVGTININGDLNGDILLPQGVLDQLLASTGPGSNNTATTNLNNTATTTNNVTESSVNNINSAATSGNANVSGNTTGGTATSGNSGTNVTLLNLTGSNTIGKNDLLVFVNVLGKWVGMIMNAPTGSNAAELGGGITSSGPNSNNATALTASTNSTTTNNTNLGITNNVNVHANSGNANVTNNTSGGNAKSGNANTAVNVLNLEGSNLDLSNWFGVLFINVFGVWNGSFGVNTSAGDPVIDPNVPTNNPVQAATHQGMINDFRKFAGFAAGGTGRNSGFGGSTTTDPTTTDTNTTDFKTAAVLGSKTPDTGHLSATSTIRPTSDKKKHASMAVPAIGFSVAILILVAGERDRLFARRK
jgi:hypothetical protein